MATDHRDPRVTDAARATGPTGTYANPMAAGQKRSADAIEADIEATRARIEARLEGLSAQTAPSRLLETTLGADLSSPSATIETLYLRAKSNPVSAALIAAGLAALYMGRRTEDPVAIARARREAELEDGREVPGPATRDAAERVAYDIAALKGQARGLGDDMSAAKARLTSSASSTSSSATSSVSAAGDAVSDTAASLSTQARETYADVSERVGDAYEGATDALARAPDYARDKARYAGSWVQENPIAAGLIGVAAGAVAASVFATSRANPPRKSANRNLYRRPDGYSTSEELQSYATRRPAPSSTAAVRRASVESGTRAKAAARAPSPASSTASQGARRAPATASETVGKTVSTASGSTVGKATTTSKSASAGKMPKRSVTKSTGAASRPKTGGRSSGTARSGTKSPKK